MRKHLLPITALMALSYVAHAQAAPSAITPGTKLKLQSEPGLKEPLTMQFTDAEVAQVLKAISIRTGAKIVYAGREKISISVDSVVSSTEEAVRTVVSIAHLVYRKMGNVYVVAPVADLRDAVEPFGTTSTIHVSPGAAARATTLLSAALPYATIRTVGENVLVTGTAEDLRDAQELVASLERQESDHIRVTETVSLHQLTFVNATQIVKDLYADLALRSTTQNLGEQGGVFAVTGEAGQVRAGIAMLLRLDSSINDDPDNHLVYRVYHLRYTSAYVMKQVLSGKFAANTLAPGSSPGQGPGANPTAVTLSGGANTSGVMFPGLDAFVGAEVYSPPRAQFNPISGSIGGTAGAAAGTSAGSGTQSGTSQNQPALDHSYQLGDRSMTLVLRGPEATVDAAEKLIRSLDIKPRQVDIEVAVVETTPTFDEDLGLNWNLSNTFNLSEGAIGASGLGFGRFTRTTPATFSAALSAAITRGEGKLVAHPRIEVTENDDADIFIGNTLYIQETSSSLAGTTTNLVPINVGIILLLRARTGPDGNISMNLDPAVSSIVSISATGIPETTTRETQTNVVVKDGETIVIGGLIQEVDTKTINEVPYLSKIPLLGELFRNRNTTKSKQNLILTITPHIVKDAEAGL